MYGAESEFYVQYSNILLCCRVARYVDSNLNKQEVIIFNIRGEYVEILGAES